MVWFYSIMCVLHALNCTFKNSTAHVIFALKYISKVALSCLTLCDPMDVAYQVPLTMGFSRQEYWSGLPFPVPGDISEPGIEPGCPALQTDGLPSEPPGKPMIKKQKKHTLIHKIPTKINLLKVKNKPNL